MSHLDFLDVQENPVDTKNGNCQGSIAGVCDDTFQDYFSVQA
jgi:hypothetical protein